MVNERLVADLARPAWTALWTALWAALLICVATTAASESRAADWPSWRGVNGDGISSETGWRTTFSDGGPRIAWEKQLGVGFGSVAVRDGLIYAMGWRDGKDFIYCIEAKSGDVKWQEYYPSERYDKNHKGGPAATPALDGDRVYTVSKEAVVHCLDAGTGEGRWRVNLVEKFDVSVPQWGFSGSAIVLGRMVLVDVGRIVALDKKTGRTIWKTEDYGSAYSTPMPFKIGAKQLVAAFPAAGLVVLDATRGKQIATHKWETSYKVNSATPIVDGNLIFITSGYNTGAALLRLDGSGLEVLWENKQMKGKMATPILIDGHLYGFDEGKLKCVELRTGQQKWDARGMGLGTLTAADGRLIVLSEQGKLVIARASPDGFQSLDEAQIFDEDQGWIVPVLAGGRIYCRSGSGRLVCIDVGGDGGP